MAGNELNIKVYSPLKLRSGLTGKKPAIAHICIYPSVVANTTKDSVVKTSCKLTLCSIRKII